MNQAEQLNFIAFPMQALERCARHQESEKAKGESDPRTEARDQEVEADEEAIKDVRLRLLFL